MILEVTGSDLTRTWIAEGSTSLDLAQLEPGKAKLKPPRLGDLGHWLIHESGTQFAWLDVEEPLGLRTCSMYASLT